jgi:hypothetical protein
MVFEASAPTTAIRSAALVLSQSQCFYFPSKAVAGAHLTLTLLRFMRPRRTTGTAEILSACWKNVILRIKARAGT